MSRPLWRDFIEKDFLVLLLLHILLLVLLLCGVGGGVVVARARAQKVSSLLSSPSFDNE